MRALSAALALIAGSLAAHAETATPTLRADVVVSSEVVRVGDLVENAGSAGGIAIYRAPDLGTTGRLPVAEVVERLRAHQLVGVDAKGLHDIAVTRAARLVSRGEVEAAVTAALARRPGFGEAGHIVLTFDRPLDTIVLDPANNGSLKAVALRFDAASQRFDASFEIANGTSARLTRLRFTGTAVETVETAVATRNVERGDTLKAADVALERRPRSEAGTSPLDRAAVIGMAARRSLRAGTALRMADLAKPDLVQRGQSVTLIYQAAGLTLTIRAKALESGTEGDTVGVLNLQSKREVFGTVIGPGQVAAIAIPPRLSPAAARAALLTAE